MSQPDQQFHRQVSERKRAATRANAQKSKRLRQDQERTGPGRALRDREFRLLALRREVRRGYGGDLAGDVEAEGAESLSKPTEGGGAAPPVKATNPDAAVPYDRTADAAGGAAQNANRQNKATEPPPDASFPGNAEPSMN